MSLIDQFNIFSRKQEEFVKKNKDQINIRMQKQWQREAKIIQETQSFCPLDKITGQTVRAEDIQKALNEGYGKSVV